MDFLRLNLGGLQLDVTQTFEDDPRNPEPAFAVMVGRD